MRKSVIIIGGGLAGLSAASALAGRGMRVLLLESRPRLGGRAGSFVDRTTGTQIDNCQHVSLGCCTNFQKLCDTVGIAGFFRRERRLYFVGPDGSIDDLAASWWPAPLHLWPGFRRLRYLSRKDKRCLSRGLRLLARNRPEAASRQSFADWLRAHGQSSEVISRFWHVVLVSALSESLDRIDVASARKVFVDAFLANRRGWEMQVPTVPLDELYGNRLTGWLAQRGAEVRLQSGIEQVAIENGRAVAVRLRGGEPLGGDEFILAVPHQRVAELLPEVLRSAPPIAGLAKLESAPISSVHLWFDRQITELPHAAFVERLCQWMFNRTALQGGAEVEAGGWRCAHQGADASRSPGDAPRLSGDALHYYQVVISASRSLDAMSQQQVIDAVAQELAAVWPATQGARLEHARLVTEHAAVFSVLPGADALRPPQQSPVGNLQFAGDWTRTGWPSTMEGAVRSGFLAAENVLSRLGRPETLLAPDLPPAPLARLLFGL